jgi:hypothetical protein
MLGIDCMMYTSLVFFIFSGLHQSIQIMVFLVVIPRSLVKPCASLIRYDPEYGVWYSEMLAHTPMVFKTGKAIT